MTYVFVQLCHTFHNVCAAVWEYKRAYHPPAWYPSMHRRVTLHRVCATQQQISQKQASGHSSNTHIPLK